MKNQEFIIYTKLNEQKIIGKIQNVIHIKKNILIKNMMFKNINRNDNSELSFKPNFGPVNIMLIAWKYIISFDTLEKGYIKVKVENKLNFLFFLPIITMLIFAGITLIPFFRENNLGNFGNIIIFMFSLFIMMIFALNYFSINSYKKKISNLLTTLSEGEIEYIK